MKTQWELKLRNHTIRDNEIQRKNLSWLQLYNTPFSFVFSIIEGYKRNVHWNLLFGYWRDVEILTKRNWTLRTNQSPSLSHSLIATKTITVSNHRRKNFFFLRRRKCFTTAIRFIQDIGEKVEFTGTWHLVFLVSYDRRLPVHTGNSLSDLVSTTRVDMVLRVWSSLVKTFIVCSTLLTEWSFICRTDFRYQSCKDGRLTYTEFLYSKTLVKTDYTDITSKKEGLYFSV